MHTSKFYLPVEIKLLKLIKKIHEYNNVKYLTIFDFVISNYICSLATIIMKTRIILP